MKKWERVLVASLFAVEISCGLEGIVPGNPVAMPAAYAREAAPVRDTWLLSDGDVQYYLKGGTLQYRQPTRDMRLSGAYSFTAKIASVYADGSSETHWYRMRSKGMIGVSIDGGSTFGADPHSVYEALFNTIVSRFIE